MISGGDISTVNLDLGDEINAKQAKLDEANAELDKAKEQLNEKLKAIDEEAKVTDEELKKIWELEEKEQARIEERERDKD